jgi:hypothetical protein
MLVSKLKPEPAFLLVVTGTPACHVLTLIPLRETVIVSLALVVSPVVDLISGPLLRTVGCASSGMRSYAPAQPVNFKSVSITANGIPV